ncbi:MAG: hypothetical protein WEA29_07125 [Acidimicrobiia bacterium]
MWNLVARVLVALAFVATACSSIAQTEPSEELSSCERIELINSRPSPDDPGPDIGGIAMREEVFADCDVTRDEYERAVLAAVECVRGDGYVVEGPYEVPPHPGRYPPGPLHFAAQEAPGVAETLDRCTAQWLHQIEMAWFDLNQPSEKEKTGWLERLWECARIMGSDLPDPPLHEDDWARVVAMGCRPWEG